MFPFACFNAQFNTPMFIPENDKYKKVKGGIPSWQQVANDLTPINSMGAKMLKKTLVGGFPVYLNVYDLTPINGYAYWLGLGVYHSGVQVHGVEYGFGAHEHETTGIFLVEPTHCPGFTFRKSIFIGTTDLGPKDVSAFMARLSHRYSGNTYHLITKNCNHFCNDVCLRLTANSIPRWVNRLARLGHLCNCVLPPDLQETKIDSSRGRVVESGKNKTNKKLRRRANEYEDPQLEIAASDYISIEF